MYCCYWYCFLVLHCIISIIVIHLVFFGLCVVLVVLVDIDVFSILIFLMDISMGKIIMIDINLIAWMIINDIRLDYISCADLVMAVGLTVDYVFM